LSVSLSWRGKEKEWLLRTKMGVKFGAKPKRNPEQELALLEDIKIISKATVAEKYGYRGR